MPEGSFEQRLFLRYQYIILLLIAILSSRGVTGVFRRVCSLRLVSFLKFDYADVRTKGDFNLTFYWPNFSDGTLFLYFRWTFRQCGSCEVCRFFCITCPLQRHWLSAYPLLAWYNSMCCAVPPLLPLPFASLSHSLFFSFYLTLSLSLSLSLSIYLSIYLSLFLSHFHADGRTNVSFLRPRYQWKVFFKRSSKLIINFVRTIKTTTDEEWISFAPIFHWPVLHFGISKKERATTTSLAIVICSI